MAGKKDNYQPERKVSPTNKREGLQKLIKKRDLITKSFPFIGK